MAKTNKKDDINKYTKMMFVLLFIVFALYIFLTFYFLGVNFECFRFFDINYNISSNFFDFVVLVNVIPMLIFMFTCLFFGEMKKLFVGEKAGSIAEFVKKIFLACVIISTLLLLSCSYFSAFITEKTYICIMIFLLCTIVLSMDIVIFLERVSESGRKPKVKNTSYSIEYHTYDELKEYFSLKLNINEFKSFDEKHCKLDYHTSFKDNKINCFVLIHLDKMNRKIIEDYYEEGFVDFFDYEFKDVDIINKEFYVYYVFVVDETNDSFKELINSITPMQDKYYFLGVGIDLSKNKLFITGHNKKKYKKEYDYLVDEFENIISDIKISN